MAENHYDLDYTGSMVDRILDTGYDLQNQGYIFRGLASHYTGTPTERTWLIAPTGSTGFGLSSPVPPGSIGICMYNGSSWYAEVLNTLTLDTAPTTGSGNGITSGAVKTLAESITNAIGQLEQSVSDRFTSLELEDTTGSLQAEVLSITLKYVFEGETEALTSLSILAATSEKAGLMSAADKQKLDAFVTNIRSLRIQDTTAQADQGTEITNTLRWTIEGVTEAITAFTLYAATTSKAGLMSAADKTALDTLPSLINAGYLYAGIATPSTVPSSTSAKIYYIAIDGGTYTNFGNLNVTQGINIIYKSGDAWSVAQVVGIDNEPTAGSDNLVKSGGVKTELALGAVYDVSAHHNGATFESLSALLSDTDLNALIPTAVRKGGMSIKFVQSSDNKYVQYRLMADEWSTDTVDWAIFVDTIEIENDVYLEAKIDNEGKLLWAIKADGTVFFGAGCPPQVQEFVIKHLATKVDKVENKSLIDTDVANSMSCIENSEYLSVETDDEDKILNARKLDGKIKEFVGIETPLIDAAQVKVNERLLLREPAKEELKYDLSLNILPKYYFENDYIVDKVKSINDIWLHTGAYADIFVFFTDAHYFNNAKMTASLMEYLLKNACIGKVVYGGDTASNGSEDIIDDIAWENKTAKSIVKYSKYFPIEGNHDYYTDEVVLPLSAVRNNLLNSCNVEGIKINEDDVAPYYYYDEKLSKIRYIVADVYYSGSYVSFGSEQIPFLAQALSSTPNGYSIVMMSHTNIQNGVVHDTTEYERLENIRKLVKAYQDKGSTTISGITYDFTNAQSSIILYIGGHGHEDLQNYLNNTLYVGIPCTASWQDAKYSPMYTYHSYQERKKGNIYEDCFDVMVLDRSNNVLNCIRIGWGFNRRYNLARIDMSVGSTEQLISIFNTVSKWLIHDSTGATYNGSISYGSERWTFTNNVATIDNNGMVTALSAGECYAIAIADNGDKEFFYIKVQ